MQISEVSNQWDAHQIKHPKEICSKRDNKTELSIRKKCHIVIYYTQGLCESYKSKYNNMASKGTSKVEEL